MSEGKQQVSTLKNMVSEGKKFYCGKDDNYIALFIDFIERLIIVC